MRDFLSMTRKLGGISLACFIVSAASGLPAYGQQSLQDNIASIVGGQKQENRADKIRMNDEYVAQPLFKDMGVPGATGVFYPRLAWLATRAESHTEGNFTSHCGTELVNLPDPQIRNDRFSASPRTVALFQFTDVTSTNGISRFPPLIESHTSSPLGAAKQINTRAGFSIVLADSRAFFNQAYITARENSWWRAAQRWASKPSKTCSSD
jgi:hypothetical protein